MIFAICDILSDTGGSMGLFSYFFPPEWHVTSYKRMT